MDVISQRNKNDLFHVAIHFVDHGKKKFKQQMDGTNSQHGRL